MKRRDFIRLAASLPAAAGLSQLVYGTTRAEVAAEGKRPPLARLSDLDAFNFTVGTQTIGATYQFTGESVLVETAQQILDLGSNILKFTMGRGYERMLLKPSKTAYPETMQYLLNQGNDAKDTPRILFLGATPKAPDGNPEIRTLTDLARLEPSCRRVFEMPFAYYLIWTYAFTPDWWHKGFSPENRDKEYKEMRAFVTHLLETYRGTGKTFFLGHWEGDWHLRPDLKTDSDRNVSAEALQGMTDWLNVRQKAVDDAKRDTPHGGVQVYHYTEVNHVTNVAMAGRPSVTNSVLPKTNVDYVSYSTYDSLGDKDGIENGYWLIDDKGVKQPVYHTHQRFCQEARRYVGDFLKTQSRPPSREEFARHALQWVGAMRRMIGIGLSLFVLRSVGDTVPPSAHRAAPVDGYAVHADGGLIYDPLRREAEQTGQLKAYKKAATVKRTVTLGDARLEVRVPKAARAYDVIPIAYTLYPGTNTVFPVAVEAVAFEEQEKSKSRNLFDLALPGKIDFGVEYLGSVTGQLLPQEKHNLTPDSTDTPKQYPNFSRAPVVKSGVVAAGDLVWFQFRLTNTGNTIFTSEGFGGGLLFPELLRKDQNGVYQPFAKTYNVYYRNLTRWYPGETWEPWIIFSIPKAGMPAEHYRLEPGEYKIRLKMTYRSYRTPDSAINYWDGPVVFIWEQPVTVASGPQAAAVPPGAKIEAPADYPNKLPTFIHTFEEFMTAFDCHLGNPGAGKAIQGVLYLQVAPWTEQAVLRLISGAVPEVATAHVPLKVDSASLSIRLPEKLPHTVAGPDGQARPVFFSQTMADMRVNVQMGPYPEKHIRAGLREMRELGVNFLATTSMPWLYDDRHKRAFNYAGDAWKYALDVAREEKLTVEAWAQYPFDRFGIGDITGWLTGTNYGSMSTFPDGYGGGGLSISVVDPLLPAANAAELLYNFSRWGDLFFQEAEGTVPIGVEDTRGWLRDDVNVRFPVGPSGTEAFRQWLKQRYATLEQLNQAWGSSFATFESIDPETHKLDRYGLRWSYADPAHPFHDWNAAAEDFDIWRTLVRAGNYRDYIALIKDRIPNAKVMFRSEGGNAIVAGLDPETRNAHFRHAYYNQRRIGAIAEVLVASGTVGYHSDYTTLPYTPTELRQLVRKGVSQGIIPAYLPLFNDMRDIAINDRYGNPYQVNYNLDTPMKGFMMHVLTASYPWYQVMLEEGGIPGIEWEDYQCDGYVTETQKRELKFYQAKLDQALKRLPSKARNFTPPPQDWRKGGIRSYNLSGTREPQAPAADVKPAESRKVLRTSPSRNNVQ